MSAIRVSWDELDLTRAPFSVRSEGTNRGNAIPVDQVIDSQLRDGALVTTLRHDNREVVLAIDVADDSKVGLNEAEALLYRVASRERSLLTWVREDDPTDAGGVFLVESAAVEHNEDDILEVVAARKSYTLRLTCQPWVRSRVATVEPLTFPGVSTVIDNGDSASAWSSTYGAVTTTDAAFWTSPRSLVVPTGRESSSGRLQVDAVRTATYNKLASHTYVSFALRLPPASRVFSLTLSAAGSQGGELLGQKSSGTVTMEPLSADWMRVSCRVGSPGEAGTFTQIRLRMELLFDGTGTPTVGLDDLRAHPATGSVSRQFVYDPRVKGSVRCPATVRLSQASGSALGDVLVFTCRNRGDGYAPPLSPYRTSTGNLLTRDGSVAAQVRPRNAGSSSNPASDTFAVPASTLADGVYSVIVRAYTTNSPGISVLAELIVQGVTVASAAVVLAEGANTSFDLIDLGVVELPAKRLAGEHAGTVPVEVRLTPTPDTNSTFGLDETWLYRRDAGSLTWITNAPARVWVESPRFDEPDGAVWVGTAADKADALFPTWENLPLWDNDHEFIPGGTRIHVVTTGAIDVVGDLEHFALWGTNPAE